MAFGAFDLLKGLNVFMFGAVHDGEDFCDEAGFIAGPLTIGTSVKWFQDRPAFDNFKSPVFLRMLCLIRSAVPHKT